MANIINMIQNGSLANNQDSWTTNSNCSYSSNGEYTTITCNQTTSGTYPTYQTFERVSGKEEYTNQVLYVVAMTRGKITNTSKPRLYISQYANGSATVTYKNMTCESDGEWHKLSSRLETYNSNNGSYFDYVRVAFGIYSSTQGDVMDIKNIGVYNLTQIFGRGNEPSQKWCDKYLEFGKTYVKYKPQADLIFDRTQKDIDNKTPKGYYNYNDLNRIEQWSEYLSGILENYNYMTTPETKIDWSMQDFPTSLQMNRIRANVRTLKNSFSSATNVPSVQNMTWQKANQLEKVLQEISDRINGMEDYFVYSGVACAGQNRLWQNRFRRVSNMHKYTKWSELEEIYWSDFDNEDRWSEVIYKNE